MKVITERSIRKNISYFSYNVFQFCKKLVAITRRAPGRNVETATSSVASGPYFTDEEHYDDCESYSAATLPRSEWNQLSALRKVNR